MAIVTIDTIGHSFGDFDVFSGLTAQIEPEAKIGLVGPNGIGKSTFLQILAGLEESETGTIDIHDDTLSGYLRQEATFTDDNHSLYDEMLTVFAPLKQMEARMREIEAAMTGGTATDAEYDEYGTLQDTFDLRGGYDYESRTKKTLKGLGFAENKWSTPIKFLSGGQRTRANLAKLLLSAPDLLILDEPTNHLDADALRWLEGTLKTWNGAVLIVSHDRYFLNTVVNTIWEMSRTGIESYRGNYTAYLQQRAQRRQRTQEEWEAVMARFWQEFRYIEKNADDPNARGRMKILAREVDAVENHGLAGWQAIKRKGWAEFTNTFGAKRPAATIAELRKAIKGLENPLQKHRNMRPKLKVQENSGETVLRTHNLRVGYDDHALFSADNIELQRGEVAALIGENGAGKSTFLKTILKQVPTVSGRTRLGMGVQVGYFAQTHDNLNMDLRVVEQLMQFDDNLSEADARHHLARYLFTGDDVYKRLARLSGGERGRLALAILALQGANLLLLDEPTNHLDIPAQEVLQTVLENFDGTIMLVSHDRYLIDRLATQIWHVENGHLRVFKGAYAAYRDQLEAQRAAQPAQLAPKPEPEPITIDVEATHKLETQIRTLEAGVQELGTLLQYAGKGNDSARMRQEYQAQRDRLNTLRAQHAELVN